MSAVSLRATEILRRLPSGRVYGAELGVWDGSLSQLLLDSGDVKATVTTETMRQAQREAVACTGFANYRAQIVQGDTADTADKVQDGSLDFVFVDADHSFHGVCRDIRAWLPKVKLGGFIGGHDYGDPNFPGVEGAVHLFFDPEDVERGANFTWFVPV